MRTSSKRSRPRDCGMALSTAIFPAITLSPLWPSYRETTTPDIRRYRRIHMVDRRYLFRVLRSGAIIAPSSIQNFVAKGIRWGGGSDYPVTPIPPRCGLWASVAREPEKGVYAKHPFGTTESVDIYTALRSHTVWPAHQVFMDDQIGSIEPGKIADLCHLKPRRVCGTNSTHQEPEM
jgi:hypothetical protein